MVKVRGMIMFEHSICNYCEHSADYGESVEYIYCEIGNRKKLVKKKQRCKKWVAWKYGYNRDTIST